MISCRLAIIAGLLKCNSFGDCHKIHEDRQIHCISTLKVENKYSVLVWMKYLKLHNGIGRVCTLIAATLILPVLAYADQESEKGNHRWGDNDEHKRVDRDHTDRDSDRHIVVRWGDHDTDRDSDRHIAVRCGDHDTDRDPGRQIASVPEGGPGMPLLITTVGAILLFSARPWSTAFRKL
jgi:hypothetical protein